MTYYCVVESYEGEISVSSFFGANKSEEKRYALTMYKKVHHVGTDHDDAQWRAAKVRAGLATVKASSTTTD